MSTDDLRALIERAHDDSLCRRCFPDAGLGLPLAEVIAQKADVQ